MEQRSSMMSGSFDDEVDWTKYDPPEALNKLPTISSETIIAVVQSSLENIRNQIQAEKLRSLERDAAIKEEAEAEAAAAAAEAEAEATAEGKGKDPETAPTCPHGHTLHPEALPTPPSSLHYTRQPPRPQKRSRFGISRILRHVRGTSETKSETSPPTLQLLTPSPKDITPSPTPFTQFIYKHLKPPSSDSLSDTTVECVSCFDDIPKDAAIKTVCHHYCPDCFPRLIQTAIDNEAQWPPKCCLNTVPFRTITKHVPAALLAAYRAKDEELKTPIESRLYCPQPDCGTWIRPGARDAAARTATCPAGHAACTACRGAAHEGAPCPRDRDTQLADRLAAEEGWRRCAGCGVLVEHREACQHMTCRCGAQFCYVCGAAWRTCACTIEQLVAVKEAAERRRGERMVEEEGEMVELRNALRLVEEFEREERRKDELRREEGRRRREERRLREREEREKREEERRVELDGKYGELGDMLAKLAELQRMVMEYEHDREMDGVVGRAGKKRAEMAAQQEVEKTELRVANDVKIADREERINRQLHARVALERKLEKDYEAVQAQFWSVYLDGLPRLRDCIRAYRRGNDERMDAWLKWKGEDMEKMRYLLDDEVAIREELMDAAKQKMEEGLAEERAEVGRKQRAEARWLDLVLEERRRLLAEVEMVERENGGENDVSWEGEGESESGDEYDEEFDDFVWAGINLDSGSDRPDVVPEI